MLVAGAFFLAFQLRFLDDPHGLPHRYEVLFAQSVGIVVVGKLVVFYAFGLYQKWWRYVSGRDFLLIFRAVAVSSAILVVFFAVAQPFKHTLPRSVEVTDFVLTMLLIAGARLAVRLIVERPSRGARVPKREVLVVGAGSGGQMVVRELQLNPNLGSTAIGFVDDDPRKRGMRMSGGLKVLGSTEEIATILDETEPDEVVIAIPSAPGTLRAKVVAACREREIRVRTLPTVFELLRGGVQLNKQLRDVQVEDVLGRDPIVVELDRVGAYLRDRIVLVTGAGGSIGSELCRQIARVGPRLLVMLDHAEDNLFEIDREMVEERHFTSVESVLADCKEPHRMLETMQRFKPDVVFHAAATSTCRSWKTTSSRPSPTTSSAPATVVDAALDSASSASSSSPPTRRCARRPVMGAPKAIAERIVERPAAQATRPPVLSARCASATCSARAAAWSRPSSARSRPAGPSPSPTPRCAATS